MANYIFSTAHYHKPRISSEIQTMHGGTPCRQPETDESAHFDTSSLSNTRDMSWIKIVARLLWFAVWGLYCLGFLCLHKLHHCCISLFRQLDIAIKSLCIFVAVSCDRIIHIGKFCKGTNNLVHIFLVIIKARPQSHIYGLRYKLSPLAELIQWIWVKVVHNADFK